jgi:hypothetical protein
MKNATFSAASTPQPESNKQESEAFGYVLKLCNRLLRHSDSTTIGDEEKLAAINLMNFHSFRLNSSQQNQPGIGFRMIRAAVGRALRSPENAPDLRSAEGLIISSSSCDHINVQHYVRSMSGKPKLAYIVKDQISFKQELSIGEWLVWLVFALNQSFRTLFEKRRINRALTIIEVLEITILLKWINRNNIKVIYDFVPFEVDSNLLYLCTRKLGVRTTKIPSPGPLSSHNKIVLCDELILSGGYHFEELRALEHQYRVNTYTPWPPERAHTYYEMYTKGHLDTSPIELGFYSHGEWIRLEKGLVEKNSSLLAAELSTLDFLGRFLRNHRQYHLTVYPHPKERKGRTTEQLREYYRRATGCEDVQIASADKPTTFRFEEADIAVTCYSTIIFERLYCGFKTLIQRIEEHDFPKPGSVLNTICFENYEQLSALILASSAINASDFFEKHALEKYLHTHFPAPLFEHG